MIGVGVHQLKLSTSRRDRSTSPTRVILMRLAVGVCGLGGSGRIRFEVAVEVPGFRALGFWVGVKVWGLGGQPPSVWKTRRLTV